MNSKKYILGSALLVIAFAGIMLASSAVGKSGLQKRVIAHGQGEIDKAVAMGCKVIRDAKTLKALNCAENVAEALGLQEDIKMFFQKEPGNKLPQFDSQSASANQQIGVNAVHNGGNTGVGRKVVVLDTGYNYLHPELSSSYLGGKDFVNNDNNPMDDQGHGSHVAGIITADGVDANAKGVSPGVGVLAGKVLGADGSGFFSDIVAGIYWAVDGPDGIYGTQDDFGADAINLSLGTGAPYLYKGFCDNVMPDMTNAVKYATQKNVSVVVAAGNSGNAGVSLPGCISYATTVGAVGGNDRVASFSGRGNALDIMAPGVGIYSSVLGNSYASWSGTSMATPMIGGVIALMKSAHPTYTHSQIEAKLFSTAKDLGKWGKDKDYGWGRVRADLAAQ